MTKKRALTRGLHRDPEHGRLKAEGLVREWLGEVGQGGAQPLPGAPKLLIAPIFPDFSRFFPVFPGTSGRAVWIPGVQTEKMGERWGEMG